MRLSAYMKRTSKSNSQRIEGRLKLNLKTFYLKLFATGLQRPCLVKAAEALSTHSLLSSMFLPKTLNPLTPHQTFSKPLNPSKTTVQGLDLTGQARPQAH